MDGVLENAVLEAGGIHVFINSRGVTALPVDEVLLHALLICGQHRKPVPVKGCMEIVETISNQ